MNERIKELARQSGATDENGSRATTVYCFTDQELKGFAELIVRECVSIVAKRKASAIDRGWGRDAAALDLAALEIEEHFGVES
jgi:hypothetical protein